MIQTNTLPNILDSHGSYAIELSEITQNTIDVQFEITYRGSVKVHSVPYRVFNGIASIRLDGVLKSIYTHFPFDFTFDGDEFRELARLRVFINGNVIQDFRVANAVLQVGNGVVMDDFQDRRLGIAERTPLFLGFPKVTSVLRGNNIQLINNSKGCPFDEIAIDSTVHIRLTKPDGSIVEMDNEMTLDIPDDATSNGVYTIVYTTNDGQELTREFTVVNAGENTTNVNPDIVFMRDTEDIGNSYEFQYQSYYDVIRVNAGLDITPNDTTRYRWRISDANGVVFEKPYGEESYIEMNPYDDTNFSPEVGTYDVTLFVLHEGQEYQTTETFEVISIEERETAIPGTIFIVVDSDNIYTPTPIMGDDIEIKQLGGEQYRCFLNDADFADWTIERPNEVIDTYSGAEVRLVAAKVNDYDFEINESGLHVLRAEVDGQHYMRNLNITYTLL